MKNNHDACEGSREDLKMYIEKLTGQARAFAEACYDQNNLEELQAPHTPANADRTDCKTWDITPQQWSDAIEAARLDREADQDWDFSHKPIVG